jgi:predicted phosphodiesterase
MSTLSWIHLSDWHQGGASFDRRIVRDALLKDVRERARISEELERLDFVVFSGDLAFGGTDDEYATAEVELIKPLLDACHLDAGRFIIVPGNHDVDRTLSANLRVGLTSFPEKDLVARAFRNRDSRLQLLAPFNAYSRFVASLVGPNQHSDSYGWKRILSLTDDIKVAFLCLNSAWLCGRNRDAGGEVDDYGHLMVGEPQIEDALMDVGECDLVVGVIHHPFAWLALKNGVDDRLKTRNRLMDVCDIILHGHEHEPASYAVQGTYGNCLIIPAGSAFERRDASLQTYANGYNYCRVDLERRRCKVHFRRFDGNRRWVPDIQTLGGQASGSLELQLSEGPLKPHHAVRKTKQQEQKGAGIEEHPRERVPAASPDARYLRHDSILFETPRLIEKGSPESVGTLNASALDDIQGGFEICVYLNDFGKGIRRLVNNRHVFAHAVMASSPYKNVFSFHRGPASFQGPKKDVPMWHIWLVTENSRGNSWQVPDTEHISRGWHHFAIRWDHTKPILELLLDGQPVIDTAAYREYWPKRVLTSMSVGCWPNPWSEHYINTWVCRAQVMRAPFATESIKESIKHCRSLPEPAKASVEE